MSDRASGRVPAWWWRARRRARGAVRALPSRGLSLASAARGRVSDARRLLRPVYRPRQDVTGFDLNRLGLQPSPFDFSRERVVHTCDFLPDPFSFSGDPFEESPHVDFARRLVDGQLHDVRRTKYYRLLEAGRLPFPHSGRIQADRRCRQFIDLVESIGTDGYSPETFGAISVVPCSDGSTMVLDGKHRLAALLVLGKDGSPVVRWFGNEARAIFGATADRAWPRRFYRKSLRALERIGDPRPDLEGEARRIGEWIRGLHLETWADVYHPIPFHEFRELTTQVDDSSSYGRLAMIVRSRPSFEGVRVLDLGCNVGFYAFSLAKRGAQVTGIDVRPEYIDITRQVARLYAQPAEFLHAAITPDLPQDGGGFDVTLCFSVLQWVIEQHGEAYGREVLKAISACSAELWFDLSVNDGHACLTCRPGHEVALVRRLLRESTSYDFVEHVGDVRPYGSYWRHVFRCRHTRVPHGRIEVGDVFAKAGMDPPPARRLP